MPTPLDIAKSIGNFTRAPGGYGGMGTGIYNIIDDATAVAEEAGAATLAGGAAEAVADTAAVLGLSTGWTVVLGLVALIAGLKILEVGLFKICDAIPFGLSSGPKSFIAGLFHPLDSLEGWAADRLGGIAQAIVARNAKMMGSWFDYFIGNAGKTGQVSDAVALKHQQSEITALQHEVQRLNSEFNKLNTEFNPSLGTVMVSPPATNVPGPVPATVPQISPAAFNTLQGRVNHILTVLPTIVHDINTIEANQKEFSYDLNIAIGEINSLYSALNGVRVTQWGVQDYLKNLDDSIKKLDYDYGQLAPKVENNTQHIHLLNPLGQLLYLGQPGLNNLKRLEDNPCQCESWPQQSVPDSQMLAAWEFLSHG